MLPWTNKPLVEVLATQDSLLHTIERLGRELRVVQDRARFLERRVGDGETQRDLLVDHLGLRLEHQSARMLYVPKEV